MTGHDDLRERLPNTPTPRELKAARLKCGISLRYLSEGLGLAPETLQAVEDGEIRAQDQVLVEWALLILRAPRPLPMYYRVTGSPWGVAVVLMFAIAVIVCVVLMRGGR